LKKIGSAADSPVSEFGGERNGRFQVIRWRKRTVVHVANSGSFAPQIRPFQLKLLALKSSLRTLPLRRLK
jgi:hypothetical protein